MEDAPTPIHVIEKEKILDSFEIKQDENIYKLNIEVINQDITMNLSVEKDYKKEYEIKLNVISLKMMNMPMEDMFVEQMENGLNNAKNISNSSI